MSEKSPKPHLLAALILKSYRLPSTIFEVATKELPKKSLFTSPVRSVHVFWPFNEIYRLKEVIVEVPFSGWTIGSHVVWIYKLEVSDPSKTAIILCGLTSIEDPDVFASEGWLEPLSLIATTFAFTISSWIRERGLAQKALI